MKPIVDYEVATVTDPTPIKLFTPNENFLKYHTTWLEDKWFPFMGFTLGAGTFFYHYSQNRRPYYAGLHIKLGAGIIGAVAFYFFKQYKTAYLADKDAMYRHYIQLHPEEFQAPERKKVGELFLEWVPIMIMGNNYYSILNLKRHCVEDDIHKAFGIMSSKFAITNQVQNRDLIDLCEAYEVLSDPFCRALYDQYGEEGIKNGVQSNDLYIGPWVYHADVISTFSKFCMLKNPISHLSMVSNGFVEIELKKFKGYSETIKLPLKITLNEIFNGVIKSIAVKRKSITDKTSNEMPVRIKVKVPRGFPTGGTLKSEVSQTDSRFKDIKTMYKFKTEDLPHKVFVRDKMNLITVQNVTLKQALFGTKIKIRTLDYKVVRVNITQVIRQDYVKTIYGEGMPDINDSTKRGAIIIKFNIIYPLYMSITDKSLCELLKKFKQINQV